MLDSKFRELGRETQEYGLEKYSNAPILGGGNHQILTPKLKIFSERECMLILVVKNTGHTKYRDISKITHRGALGIPSILLWQ